MMSVLKAAFDFDITGNKMQGNGVSNSKKIAVGIIGLMMLVVLSFSAFYIASELNHECDGEDCPICEFMQQCVNTLHQISDGAIAYAAAVVLIVYCLISVLDYDSFIDKDTLVSIKIRLNN